MGYESFRPRAATTGRLSGGRVKHTIYPVKYMVVTGDLTTGFQFYGPFDTVEKAEEWAAHGLKVGVWNLLQLFNVRDGA